MALESLNFKSSVLGLLIDGDPETPYLAGRLDMVKPQGAIVEIPYLHHGNTDQFAAVRAWFSTRTPPKNMVLKTSEGDISLYDVEWSSHAVKTGQGISTGRVRPREVVLGRRDGDLSEPLLIAEVRSKIDGLRELSGFTAVSRDRERDSDGKMQKLIVEVQSVASIEWRQGDATMMLQTDWRTAGPEAPEDPSFGIFDSVVLDSRFSAPVGFAEHLAEQRKVVQLLILLFDGPIRFRQHRVRDASFSVRVGPNRPLHHPFLELISRSTVADFAEEYPSEASLQQPLVYLGQVGEEGLARWGKAHAEWRRFILPAAGVLGRKGAFIEDQVASLSMALEAASGIIGKRQGEETTYRGKSRTSATNFYRCLHLIDSDWGERVVDLVGLSRACADTYNGIKHFDRGEFPDAEQSYVISLVLRHMVRMLSLHLLDPSGALLRGMREESSPWRIRQLLEDFELKILEDGSWGHEPGPDVPVPDGMSFL